MKPKLNRKRRASRAFNGIDQATGYAVRFVQTKSGSWSSVVRSFMALSCAPSLRTVKRHTHEAIGYHLDFCLEDGLPVPRPENRTVPFCDEYWPCLVLSGPGEPSLSLERSLPVTTPAPGSTCQPAAA